MRALVSLCLAAAMLVPAGATAMCRCKHVGIARCATPDEKHRKFLTPTLRQVVTTSPYFHAGSADTSSDVLDHLDAHAGDDPNDPPVCAPLGLTADERFQIYAFLKTLRSPPVAVRGPTGKLCDDAAVATLRAHLPE